jgi:hypothetical protein
VGSRRGKVAGPIACVAAALGVLVWSPVHSVAAPSGPITSTRTAHGVRLSISLRRRAFPRDALVRVILRIRNYGSQSHQVIEGDCLGDSWSPEAVVLDRHGQPAGGNILPPPPIDDALCTGPPPRLLEPGASWTLHPYVILHGAEVEGQVTLDDTYTLRTPPIPLRLDRQTRPTAILITTPSVHAVLRSESSVVGPIYYSDWFTCPTPNGTLVGGQRFSEEPSPLPGGSQPFLTGAPMQWTQVASPDLHPGCPHPGEWHLVFGWLNHPVGRIDYNNGH